MCHIFNNSFLNHVNYLCICLCKTGTARRWKYGLPVIVVETEGVVPIGGCDWHASWLAERNVIANIFLRNVEFLSCYSNISTKQMFAINLSHTIKKCLQNAMLVCFSRSILTFRQKNVCYVGNAKYMVLVESTKQVTLFRSADTLYRDSVGDGKFACCNRDHLIDVNGVPTRIECDKVMRRTRNDRTNSE